jgi:hypothetical protein
MWYRAAFQYLLGIFRINKQDLRSEEFGKREGFIWDFGPHASLGLHGRKTRARAENQ